MVKRCFVRIRVFICKIDILFLVFRIGFGIAIIVIIIIVIVVVFLLSVFVRVLYLKIFRSFFIIWFSICVVCWMGGSVFRGFIREYGYSLFTLFFLLLGLLGGWGLGFCKELRFYGRGFFENGMRCWKGGIKVGFCFRFNRVFLWGVGLFFFETLSLGVLR